MEIGTYSDYLKDLESTATAIISDWQAENLGEIPDLSLLDDAILEAADSAVIYHYDCSKILEHSDNKDEAEAQGLLEPSTDIDQLNQARAFWAYKLDLTEAVEAELDNTDFIDYDPEAVELAQYIQKKLQRQGLGWLEVQKRSQWILDSLNNYFQQSNK